MIQEIQNFVRAVKMVSVRWGPWGKGKYSDVGKKVPDNETKTDGKKCSRHLRRRRGGGNSWYPVDACRRSFLDWTR